MRQLPVTRLVPLVLVVGLFAGCRPKTSPEYYKAEADYSVLVSAQGDDAYADPKMADVLARLKAIPANVREAQLVQALIAKIEAEAKRVAEEKATSDKAMAAADVPTAPMNLGSDPSPRRDSPGANLPPPAVGPADGGAPSAPKPYGDMPKEEFLKWYGGCVDQGPDVQLAAFPKKGAGYQVKDRADCQQRLGVGPGQTSFVFVEGKLKGQVTRTETRTETVVDAGPRPSPPPPERKDFSIIPGGPIPDELRPPAPPATEEQRTY